jgi:hypothetical protein
MVLPPVAPACRFSSSRSELKSAARRRCAKHCKSFLIKMPSFGLAPAPRPAGLLAQVIVGSRRCLALRLSRCYQRGVYRWPAPSSMRSYPRPGTQSFEFLSLHRSANPTKIANCQHAAAPVSSDRPIRRFRHQARPSPRSFRLPFGPRPEDGSPECWRAEASWTGVFVGSLAR